VEDLDDDAGAIQDRRGRGRALDVAELARREIVVDDDDGGARLSRAQGRLLAARRVGLFGRLPLPGRPFADDAGAAGPAGQLRELALAEQRGGARPFCVTRRRPRRSTRRLEPVSDDLCSRR
jgi:hypothetical protein